MPEDPVSVDAEVEHERAGLVGRHTRRALFHYSAVTTAAIAIPTVLEACGGGSKHSRPSQSYKPVALTSAEFAMLTAVTAQLFPKDDLGPGAVEAGVPVYIDHALAGSYKPLLSVYQGFLPMFDKAAASLGAKSFSALSDSHQVALLTEFEAGKPNGVSAAEQATAAENFQLLLEHTREGMFADPMYGGNRGLVGWDLVGYPGVILEFTAHDQTVGVKLPPAHKTATTYRGAPYNGPTL
jgi:gluconate 2-dehydrogenase gamma chain